MKEFAIVVPAVARIPMKMMIDVPLPMPYSVILSLSHMTMMLPATSNTIVIAIVRIALPAVSNGKIARIVLLNPTTMPIA